MTRAALLLAAVLQVAAQPKLLVNAKLDTHSAAQGLDSAFQAQVAAVPQPSWIAYSVPTNKTMTLGCEFVSNDGTWFSTGTIHLEPPDNAVILFRIASGAVERVRTLSPDCQFDAGGVPFHWLTEVQPAQSVALLAGLATKEWSPMSSAMGAIAVHADPSADQTLDKFAGSDQMDSLRGRAITYLGSARGKHGFDVLKGLIANDPDKRIRTRAITALQSSKEPEALDLLITLSKPDKDVTIRTQAVRELGHKRGPQAVAALGDALNNDTDMQVKRAACTSLQGMPDGEGVPVLIQFAKNTKDVQLRRQAMTSLQNSHDPRAVAFFLDVLKN